MIYLQQSQWQMTKEENERKKEGKQQHIRNKEWNRMQAKAHAGFEKVPKTHKKPNKSNQIKTKTRKKENEYKIIFPRIKPKIYLHYYYHYYYLQRCFLLCWKYYKKNDTPESNIFIWV